MKYRHLFIVFLFASLTSCQSTRVGNDAEGTKMVVISNDEYKIWELIDSASVSAQLNSQALPKKHQTLTLNIKRIKVRLSQLDKQDNKSDEIRFYKNQLDEVKVQFPWDDGNFYTFLVKKSGILSPDLAKKFPNIRSYSGKKIDDKNTNLRLDINPAGLFAMITTPSRTLFIRPLEGEEKFYLCYDKDQVDLSNKKYYEAPVKNRANN